MATNTKTASRTGKTSSKTTDKSQKTRRTFSEWRGDIKEAKGIGFAHGYDCIEELPPNLKGGRMAAQSGFRKGAKARQSAQKAEAKARQYRNRTHY